MVTRMDRRTLLIAALAAAAVPAAGRTEEVVDLTWDDLLPDDARFARSMQSLGIVGHGDLATGFEQPRSTGVTTRWNNRTVRLPGFVVPLDFEGTGVTAFILVPYRGACVHVPPPPANQLVLVTSQEPYEMRDPDRAVIVEGMFGAAATSTGLAQIGYALSADRITLYKA